MRRRGRVDVRKYLCRFIDPEELDGIVINEKIWMTSPTATITSAFTWDKTPQGYDFWSRKAEELAQAIYIRNFDGQVIEARDSYGNPVPVVQISQWLLTEGECPVCKSYLDGEELDAITVRESISGRITPSGALVSAFTWEKTPQGHDFWSRRAEKLSNAVYISSYDGDVTEARDVYGNLVPVIQINGWLLGEGECPVCKSYLDGEDECPVCGVDFDHLTVEEVYFPNG
jgi:ribosomal protein S19E (S16A)